MHLPKQAQAVGFPSHSTWHRLLNSVVVATLVFAAGAVHVEAGVMVDTNWFSNGSSVQNVIDPPFPGFEPERLRLQGGFNSGFIEGTVNLPFHDTWTIDGFVSADSNFAHATEFVEIFVDGTSIDKIFNTPLSAVYPFQHVVTGNQFTYRFEFDSPSINEGEHLIVSRGTATSETMPVPEASSFVMWLLLGIACRGLHLRRWKS